MAAIPMPDCTEVVGVFNDSVDVVDVLWPTNDLGFTVRTLVDVLMTLEISMMGIIADSTGVPLINSLIQEMNNPSLPIVTYFIDDVSTSGTVLESCISMLTNRMDETLSLVLCGDPVNTLWTFRHLTKYLDSQRQTGIEHHTRWLTVSPRNCLEDLENEMSRLDNVLVVSPVWDGCDVITNSSQDGRHRLGLYSMHITDSCHYLQNVGHSMLHHGLVVKDAFYPNVGHGFNGRHFIIALYVWDPFTIRVNKSNKITYEGFCVDLVEELSRRLNFKYTFTEPEDNQWGAPTGDGNWTGVVGLLHTFKVDVAVAAIITTEDRELVMDATFPFYYDHVGVLYKRVDPQKGMWKTYFHPFKKEVFLCIGTSVFLACLVYYALGVVSPSKTAMCQEANTRSRTSYRHDNVKVKGVSSCNDRLTHMAYDSDSIVASLVQQGRPRLPTHCSGRVFLAFWWIFSITMAAIYKANLTAFLAVPIEEVPFTTLYDLATQDEYRWGVTGSTVVEYLFQESKRIDFKLLGQGIEEFKESDKNINSLDPLVHLNKVKAGGYAYISDMVPMEIWMSEDCDLRLLTETVIPLPFVVGLHNESGFLHLFNKHLLDIDQLGLYNVWKQRWWPHTNKCKDDQRTAKKILSLLEMQSSFYVTCIGIGLGAICLCVEICLTTKFCKVFVYSPLHTFIQRFTMAFRR